MKLKKFFCKALILTILSILPAFSLNALADQPKPWETGFQEPASPVMEKLVSLHSALQIMTFGVSIFVLVLLLYVCFRFSAKRNPIPSKTSHNTLIEIIWTVVPILILVAIIIPSWRLIHMQSNAPADTEITIKAIGYQWYWGYEYMDGPGKGIHFESYMKMQNPPKGQESLQLQPGEPRNLANDNHILVPVDTNVKVLTTAADVIHAWAVPAFGVKIDAVPGRINQTWFRVTRPGLYYGQCSELCGSRHAFMPITVEAVSREEYNTWVAAKKAALGIKDEAPTSAEGATDKKPAPAAVKVTGSNPGTLPKDTGGKKIDANTNPETKNDGDATNDKNAAKDLENTKQNSKQ